MSQFYAVRSGKVPGIYNTWAECQAQTKGISGAVFQKFKTVKEAKNFLKLLMSTQPKNKK